MEIFIVEYTMEHMPGDDLRTMEIEAQDIADAWLILDINYPHLLIDGVYPKDYEEEHDGQPTELEEWLDFDPDC